jgi:phosphatidylglycerophosphatase A
VAIFIVGWWASEQVVREDGAEDPGWIVIDEVAGQWLTLLLTPPSFLGLALFRLFDIVKPWPASWADRQVKGGLGIMLDDILAGLMALIVLAIVQWLRLL